MAKRTVADSLDVDVLKFARAGWLAQGYQGTWTGPQGEGKVATLSFHVEGGFLYVDCLRAANMITKRHFPVELTYTRTSFGAERVWLVCQICGRVVGKLYLPPEASELGCRYCHSLTYPSRQKWGYSSGDEALEAANREEPEPSPHRSRRGLQGVGFFLEGMSEEVAPPKRPPGRPKKKRPYERRRPFLTGQRTSASQGLCLRCRDYRELKDPVPVTLSNRRPALEGTCPVCGAKMMLIIKAT